MRSLLNQTINFNKYEIILIDDASTDKTKEAIKTFVGDIVYIENEKKSINIDLAKKIKKLLGNEKKISRGPNTPGSPKRRVPDLKFTRQFTQISKFTNLDQGLRKYVSWFLNSQSNK